MKNNNTPAEGKDSAQTESESALRGAACCASFLCKKCGNQFNEEEAKFVDVSAQSEEQAIACPLCYANNIDEDESLEEMVAHQNISVCEQSFCQCQQCLNYRTYLKWAEKERQKDGIFQMLEEIRHLKDQLATLSITHAKDMQRLSDIIDKRQEALRYISEIIEEKAAKREDLEIGSTAYKSVRRWSSLFLHNKEIANP